MYEFNAAEKSSLNFQSASYRDGSPSSSQKTSLLLCMPNFPPVISQVFLPLSCFYGFSHINAAFADHKLDSSNLDI